MDHDQIRLYVLNPDESVRWERRFGRLEQTTALAAWHEAIALFPGRVVVLCDLAANRVLAHFDPALDRLPDVLLAT